jgi:hypothetical protein
MILLPSIEAADDISVKYDVGLSEVLFTELNRSGVWAKGEIPVGFRARFLCKERFSAKESIYIAVPSKSRDETLFWISPDNHLLFDDFVIGEIWNLEIDTCDCSYFRKGRRVLNLNSNQRGSCKGCLFCIHNYPLYDSRVLKDQTRLLKKDVLRGFLENEIIKKHNLQNLEGLEQIAIVTGLFVSERELVEHIGNLRAISGELGFHGPIFFLGSELRSFAALQQVQEYKPFSFCYSVDCFTDRTRRLNKRKGNYSLSEIAETLDAAQGLGFETTFSYIVGLDSLDDIAREVARFKRYVNRFPIVNIYQTQHPGQTENMPIEATRIDYFLEARHIFEAIFTDTELRPHNWENYRSLWTHSFATEYIPE